MASFVALPIELSGIFKATRLSGQRLIILSCRSTSVNGKYLLLSESILPKTKQTGIVFWRMGLLLILTKLDDIAAFIDSFHGQPQGLQLFYKHPERGWNTWLFYGLTFHDRFICIHAALK